MRSFLWENGPRAMFIKLQIIIKIQDVVSDIPPALIASECKHGHYNLCTIFAIRGIFGKNCQVSNEVLYNSLAAAKRAFLFKAPSTRPCWTSFDCNKQNGKFVFVNNLDIASRNIKLSKLLRTENLSLLSEITVIIVCIKQCVQESSDSNMFSFKVYLLMSWYTNMVRSVHEF